MALGNAYFVNASPTEIRLTLNGGLQVKLDPISVNSAGNAVTGPAKKFAISANKGEDVFGGNGVSNEITVRTTQTGRTAVYTIESKVPTTLDLYFFMFEGSVVGEDQTGSSSGIKITPLLADAVLSLAATLSRDSG